MKRLAVKVFILCVALTGARVFCYAQDAVIADPATQDAAKQDAAKQDAAKQDAAKQDAAKRDEPGKEGLKSEQPRKEETKRIEPLTVNGDKVEYLSDKKEFMATGNVEVDYKGMRLTCDKLSVDASTKSGIAEGHARLEDKGAVIEGEKIIYNFDAKSGILIDAGFRVSPYFGKAEKIQKKGDNEFIASYGYMTTCSLDNPHWRFKSRKIDMFPGNRVALKDTTVYVGGIPLLYLSQLQRSLKDPLMHVQVMAGKRKDWGPYVLSAWRYELTESSKGNIFFDTRFRLGLAEGFDNVYKSEHIGSGNFKFYYTHEVDTKIKGGLPNEFQRYLVRERHKWDIDPYTNLVAEYYKIVDSKREVPVRDNTINFLKDYFPREYEKDSHPLSYVQIHRMFDYSSLDVLVQPRTNNWYSETQSLPSVTYSMPSLQLGNSPFYFQHTSAFDNLVAKNAVPSPSESDTSLMRFDTTQKFSLPTKVSIFNVQPFVADRTTFYDKDVNGRSMWGAPRTIFSYGADASTRFFRLYNVKGEFLGMKFDGIRHLVTPSVSYTYQHEPTLSASRIKFSDLAAVSNSAVLELSNKLQTKRGKSKIDVVDLRLDSNYNFKTGDGNKKQGSLGDILTTLDIRPYSWMGIHGDSTYVHSGSYDHNINPDFGKFSTANYDLNFNVGNDRSFGIGQRYQRKGGNEITYAGTWRFNPKWKFTALQRYQMTNKQAYRKGLWEQEYTLARDMHCWVFEGTLNSTVNNGTSLYFVFRLKAFPELQFSFDQSYSAPRSGSQTAQ